MQDEPVRAARIIIDCGDNRAALTRAILAELANRSSDGLDIRVATGGDGLVIEGRDIYRDVAEVQDRLFKEAEQSMLASVRSCREALRNLYAGYGQRSKAEISRKGTK